MASGFVVTDTGWLDDGIVALCTTKEKALEIATKIQLSKPPGRRLPLEDYFFEYTLDQLLESYEGQYKPFKG